MRIVLAFIAVLVVATSAGIAFAAFVMGAPASDLQQLAVILGASGTASLIVGWGAVRWLGGLGGRRYGLRWRVAAVYGAGLAVTLINVLAASLLMFLSTHDLLLLLLTLGFATVLSVLFGRAVTGALVADLDRLAAAARKLAGGDLTARTKLRGADEVAQLGTTFDQMADQLQAGIERERAQELARREMVAAVSHDLRTPLTTMRAMVEAVTDGVVTEPEEVRRYLELIRGEVRHLSRLIDDLFELSQIESGALRLDLAPTDLPELVAQTLEAYEAPARDSGVTLEHAADPSIPPVQADPARLMRVLRNLIDNALRHTPAGGTVQVEARVEATPLPLAPPLAAVPLAGASLAAAPQALSPSAVRTVRISVKDTGPGLPEGETERVFERFYRSPRARTRADKQPPGAGLGLTIARGLVQAHGGRMWAETRSGEGASFHFTLPLAA